MTLLPGLAPDSRWRHHSGRYYTVLLLANVHAGDQENYPRYVIYRDDSGRTWAKSPERFLASMTPEIG